MRVLLPFSQLRPNSDVYVATDAGSISLEVSDGLQLTFVGMHHVEEVVDALLAAYRSIITQSIHT